MTLTQLLEVNPTRRSFVEAAIKGTFGAAVSTFLPLRNTQAEQEQTFAEWHESTISEEEGEKFTHPLLTAYTLNPAQVEIETLDKVLKHHLSITEANFAKHIKDQDIVRLSYRGTSEFTLAPLDKASLQECRARYNQELNVFYKYLGEKKFRNGILICGNPHQQSANKHQSKPTFSLPATP
tara:strand:- start:1371 stop:1913 length:543 start_codon:yes stop_codon:yes gene_type:complete